MHRLFALILKVFFFSQLAQRFSNFEVHSGGGDSYTANMKIFPYFKLKELFCCCPAKQTQQQQYTSSMPSNNMTRTWSDQSHLAPQIANLDCTNEVLFDSRFNVIVEPLTMPANTLCATSSSKVLNINGGQSTSVIGKTPRMTSMEFTDEHIGCKEDFRNDDDSDTSYRISMLRSQFTTRSRSVPSHNSDASINLRSYNSRGELKVVGKREENTEVDCNWSCRDLKGEYSEDKIDTEKVIN